MLIPNGLVNAEAAALKKAKKYSLLGFWRAVLIRSISTLGQLGNILTVIAYISIFWLTLVNIGLLEDIIQQTIENLISWAASIWLVFLIMVITPYSLWKEVSKDRDKLIDNLTYRAPLTINSVSQSFDAPIEAGKDTLDNGMKLLRDEKAN